MAHRTRKLHIGKSKRLDELSRSSADLWNEICTWYWRWVDRQDHWTSKGQMQKWCVNGHDDFQAHSAQAVNDQFYDAINSWHKNNRKGNPPRNRSKRWNKICWKKSAIKMRDDGVLRLSCGRGNDPVLIDWPVDKKPVYAEIGWAGDGYEIRATYEVETEDRTTGDEITGIDLGEKHLAAAATEDDSFLLNGGELRALRKYQNQTKAKLQRKISRKERGSKRWKRLVRTKNKQLNHLDNKITDLLHKLSRKLIEMLLERGVSTVVIGELKGIRDSVDYGSRMNQRLHQWAHAKFAQMVEYKAKGAGMIVKYVNEEYTSQTCPKCQHRHKPSGRTYDCPECGYSAQRDAVGAYNIRKKYVGTEDSSRLPGVMASPSGVRFHPHLSCSSRSRRKTQSKSDRQPV
ncbi:RNA-guided endonuclease InsQ/TnpB family protein [Salinibacter ruber]|uniref:RNA-guided endonuclease InsQ/TnpB family protein n=2 Tax=Salinibacter ruber TaxID=146919 RepID=UPI002072DBE7|nr:transposase [Salinibacter ruber]